MYGVYSNSRSEIPSFVYLYLDIMIYSSNFPTFWIERQKSTLRQPRERLHNRLWKVSVATVCHKTNLVVCFFFFLFLSSCTRSAIYIYQGNKPWYFKVQTTLLYPPWGKCPLWSSCDLIAFFASICKAGHSEKQDLEWNRKSVHSSLEVNLHRACTCRTQSTKFLHVTFALSHKLCNISRIIPLCYRYNLNLIKNIVRVSREVVCQPE